MSSEPSFEPACSSEISYRQLVSGCDLDSMNPDVSGSLSADSNISLTPSSCSDDSGHCIVISQYQERCNDSNRPLMQQDGGNCPPIHHDSTSFIGQSLLASSSDPALHLSPENCQDIADASVEKDDEVPVQYSSFVDDVMEGSHSQSLVESVCNKDKPLNRCYHPDKDSSLHPDKDSSPHPYKNSSPHPDENTSPHPNKDLCFESDADLWERSSSESSDMNRDNDNISENRRERNSITHGSQADNESDTLADDNNIVSPANNTPSDVDDVEDYEYDDKDDNDDEEESSGTLSPSEWLLKDSSEDHYHQLPSSHVLRKSFELELALAAEPVDIGQLRELALSEGGLLKCQWRRKAWLLLAANSTDTDFTLSSPLSIEKSGASSLTSTDASAFNSSDASLFTSTDDTEEVEKSDRGATYRDRQQVIMDVRRTLSRFPPRLPSVRRAAVQRALVRLIIAVLSNRPHLHYYQGFHDVALTILLVFNARASEPCRRLLAILSASYLRPFLAPTMQPASDLLSYMTALVEAEDRELATFMSAAEVGTVFAVPWLLTWYSHVLPSGGSQLRVFDWVLACGPLAPLYLAAVLVLRSRDQLLAVSCDLASLHVHLSKLPSTAKNWEDILSHARELMITHPPDSLQLRVNQLNLERNCNEQLMRRKGKQKLSRDGRAAVMVRVAGAAAVLVVAMAAQWWWVNQH